MFYIFLDNIILFDVFLLTLIFYIKNWRIGEFCCRWDKWVIHLFMTSTGEGGSQDFRQFCEWLRMVLGEGVLTPLDVHMYMKQVLLSMIFEDTLNFFASQLFYCFLETCLICSPAMKRLEVRKNFMRFGSSTCTCFLIMLLYLWDSSTLRACYLSISISLWKLFF